MGQDRTYAIFDAAGHPGHILERHRTLVAFTRAKNGFVILLSTLDFLTPALLKKHTKLRPLFQVVHILSKRGFVHKLTRKNLSKLPQYTEVLEVLGRWTPGDASTRKVPRMAPALVFATACDDEDALAYDEEDQDLVDLLEAKLGYHLCSPTLPRCRIQRLEHRRDQHQRRREWQHLAQQRVMEQYRATSTVHPDEAADIAAATALSLGKDYPPTAEGLHLRRLDKEHSLSLSTATLVLSMVRAATMAATMPMILLVMRQMTATVLVLWTE